MNIEISPKEYERELNWEDGMMYCQLLTIDGKNDWRMPTKKELNEIYHSENDFIPAYFWSATEYKGIGAWGQSMSNGYHGFYSKNNISYVRAVRTI